MNRHESASQPVLKAQGLSLGFGADTVLEGVDLDLAPQEFVAIVGASGVGKSTLLRALAGLLKPQHGQVALRKDTAPDKRSWSMVFQAPRLFPWRRVHRNVELGLEGLKLSRRERRQRALETLSLVDLADYAERWPGTLSGGQQQRVGIARALAVRPDVLFMDEPFSALDAITRRRLQAELVALRTRTEAAIVFVTHDIEEAVLLADRVIVLGKRGEGPAGVVARVDIDLPLEGRREHDGFADRVYTIEKRIGTAATEFTL
ncbi:ABC transporter ATP-binding protein [Pistricoccus aurantiacus]|uniref:ABC transporter ATP-binding protein n=1 Tax=Pistricoccus aurantiacus TaxID=1883414 RepID=A0A5B8SST8_9GAMM|nr:ABC transporter ATP-binding protein [Pistricoccus aurantiacus]QEA38153.1 ABC transporter ATP-binding protein [Pistricoccus aurantiacus]